ncbi:hypothetical protein B484DRAFT_441183, partial [Ochromonadaceae sp. CCMP2298]
DGGLDVRGGERGERGADRSCSPLNLVEGISSIFMDMFSGSGKLLSGSGGTVNLLSGGGKMAFAAEGDASTKTTTSRTGTSVTGTSTGPGTGTSTGPGTGTSKNGSRGSTPGGTPTSRGTPRHSSNSSVSSSRRVTTATRKSCHASVTDFFQPAPKSVVNDPFPDHVDGGYIYPSDGVEEGVPADSPPYLHVSGGGLSRTPIGNGTGGTGGTGGADGGDSPDSNPGPKHSDWSRTPRFFLAGKYN